MFVNSFELIQGDCVKILKEKLDNSEGVAAHLLVWDPPYNFGQEYDSYEDRLKGSEYLELAKGWLQAADSVLHSHGTAWLFIPDAWVADLHIFCRDNLRWYRRSWVVWYYTFGQSNKANFAASHLHLLYYVKDKNNFHFDISKIRVPSARQLVYNDKRAKTVGKSPDNVWLLVREEFQKLFQPDFDTWLESRICGTFKERKGHVPNQIPLPIWERIIKSCCRPGGFILDPFCGTAGCGEAALRLGCQYLGIDVSKTAIKHAQDRLLKVAAEMFQGAIKKEA